MRERENQKKAKRKHTSGKKILTKRNGIKQHRKHTHTQKTAFKTLKVIKIGRERETNGKQASWRYKPT